MKDTCFLYSIAILAVFGIAVVFVGYATDTLPMHSPKPQASAATIAPEVTTTLIVKEKSCGCCSEWLARIREMIKKARKHKQAKLQTTGHSTNTNASGD